MGASVFDRIEGLECLDWPSIVKDVEWKDREIETFQVVKDIKRIKKLLYDFVPHSCSSYMMQMVPNASTQRLHKIRHEKRISGKIQGRRKISNVRY